MKSTSCCYCSLSILLLNACNLGISDAKKLGRTLVNGGTLQEEDKQALLDIHNEYRSDTALGQSGSQPMAQDMTKLIWDDSLEQDAKRYADRCNFEHDPNNDAQGENLFTAASSVDSLDNLDRLKKGIFRFYNEHQYYTYDTGRCSRQPCGHYTQVVWADTTRIGCAYSECTDISFYRENFPYQILMVCRYLSPGNWIGKKPYTEANNMNEVASFCPEGYIGKKSSGLCEMSTGNTAKVAQHNDKPSPILLPMPSVSLKYNPASVAVPASKPTEANEMKVVNEPSSVACKCSDSNGSAIDVLIPVSVISEITNSQPKDIGNSNDVSMSEMIPPPTNYVPQDYNSKSIENGNRSNEKEGKNKDKNKKNKNK